jgi:protoporphyrinogen oxidase
VNDVVEVYDKIIVTAPLQFLPNYFDATEEEKELFSKIDYERYDVLAVETKPENHPEISYYIFDNMTPERYGHLMVYYRRWKDSVDQVITTYALRNHRGKRTYKTSACKKIVLQDLEAMGNAASKVVNEKNWYYFPHVFTEDYAAGWYDKVEAMQGMNGTYYAGEIMSFGDMDETAEYSRELVDRFF